jgi:asparagine synthase (glutamine-hydrolysing)
VCGICGVAFAARREDAEQRVRAMATALRHRGPDEEGFLVREKRAPGLALGVRRLSIIDLAGGHQPVWNETKDVAAVYNGELYNYRELRERLTLLGHRFATQSDTEVLVHSWEEWGEECLTEFRGMFAFALLDLRERFATAPLLFLARDPLGIKPLYYAQTPAGFAFASEVRALLAGGLPKQLSPDALTSYLLFGSVSEPVTLLEGIFSLPPGHRMLLYVPDRRRVPRARPWWDPQGSPAARDTRKPRDLSSAAAQLRPLLQDAVRAHLIADVPAGLFLSSGLDSSAIAALAASAQGGIRSFTLAFPGTSHDEAPLARVVAERFRTRHKEVPLDGSAVLARLDEALAALDQPTMDGINTYFVSWAAREVGLKVALSGLGGDELFAGYRTFADAPRLARLIRLAWFVPLPLRRAVLPLVKGFLIGGQGTPDAARKAGAAWVFPDALPHAYFFTRALFPPGELSRLTEPRFRPSTVGADGVTLDPTWLGWLERIAHEARNLGPLAAIAWLEMRTYMASTLLRDTDSVSMAQSLEVRVPLLDTPVVEFVGSLPEEARCRPDAQKALLAGALGDLLPQEIVRQPKRTFTLPWEEWLRGPLRARLENSFADPAPSLAPHLRSEGVRGVWAAFLGGKTSWSRPWSLYVLNEWCRQHLAA